MRVWQFKFQSQDGSVIAGINIEGGGSTKAYRKACASLTLPAGLLYYQRCRRLIKTTKALKVIQ